MGVEEASRIRGSTWERTRVANAETGGERGEEMRTTSPGGPLAKTLYSQSRGPMFDPWSGN